MCTQYSIYCKRPSGGRDGHDAALFDPARALHPAVVVPAAASVQCHTPQQERRHRGPTSLTDLPWRAHGTCALGVAAPSAVAFELPARGACAEMSRLAHADLGPGSAAARALTSGCDVRLAWPAPPPRLVCSRARLAARQHQAIALLTTGERGQRSPRVTRLRHVLPWPVRRGGQSDDRLDQGQLAG